MDLPHRKNSMMAMLDAKPVEGAGERNGEQYWNDLADDHLSPIRKNLISTYLQVPDEEAMPLLGEYFGVALSFVALGALVRASNSTKRKHKKATEEERLDLRSCSRFQRMALESMLKESMERLRILSLNAYQMEERVRSLVDENVAQERERVQLLTSLAAAEKGVRDLKDLRRADGRANEKVMGIVADKEQEMIREKKNLQKEVEKLKETINSMTREAKMQARRCRSSTCEHCKGSDRILRSTSKGKVSLRELHGTRDFQSSFKRDILKLDRPLAATPMVDLQQEDEEELEMLQSIVNMRSQGEHSDYLKIPSNAEAHDTDAAESSNASRVRSGESAKGLGQSSTKERLVRKQEDFESELASILKRVGMLKQRSHSSTGSSKGKAGILAKEIHLPVDGKASPEPSVDETELELQFGELEIESKAAEPTVIPQAENSGSSVSSNEDTDDHDFVELGDGFAPEDDQGVSTSDEETLEADVVDAGSAVVPAETRTSSVVITHEEIETALSPDEEVELSDEDLEAEVGNSELLTADGPRLAEGPNAQDGPVTGMQREEELSETSDVGEGSKSAEAPTVSADTKDESDVDEAGTASSALADQQVNDPSPDLASESDIDVLENGTTKENERGEFDETLEDPLSEASASNADVSTAESEGHHIHQEVKRADEGHEQVLEVVRLESAMEVSEDTQAHEHGPGTLSDQRGRDSEGVLEQDHTEQRGVEGVQDGWDRENSPSSTKEHQDIPLFERSNVEDQAAELPEPEEKRVCEPEVVDSNAARSIDGLSGSVAELQDQQVNDKFIDASRASTDGVEGKEDGIAHDIGFVSDEKPKAEKVKDSTQDPEVQHSVS